MLLAIAVVGLSGSVAGAPHTQRAPHPEPRVIVNVVSLQGAHEQAAVQRSARQQWGKIIRCYKSIDRRAKGSVAVEVAISRAGTVTTARRIESNLDNDELAACLTGVLERCDMPKAERDSVARITIEVAPGDGDR